MFVKFELLRISVVLSKVYLDKNLQGKGFDIYPGKADLVYTRTKFIYILHLTRSNWETCVIYSICRIYMTVSNLTMYTVRLVRGCIGMAWSHVRFLPDGSARIIHNCSSLRLKMYINLRSNIPTTKTRPYL